MNRVFLILASNREKEKNLAAAVQMLREMSNVVAVSGVYETAATITPVERPLFWNVAVVIETRHTPAEIQVHLLTDIEQRLRRSQPAGTLSPGAIEIHIALFADEVREYDVGEGRTRSIPDPDLLQYLYVIAPVAELAPNMPHPVTGEPLQAIADRMLQQSMPYGKPSIFRRGDVSL